jgi:hypothetical protein
LLLQLIKPLMDNGLFATRHDQYPLVATDTGRNARACHGVQGYLTAAKWSIENVNSVSVSG